MINPSKQSINIKNLSDWCQVSQQLLDAEKLNYEYRCLYKKLMQESKNNFTQSEGNVDVSKAVDTHKLSEWCRISKKLLECCKKYHENNLLEKNLKKTFNEMNSRLYKKNIIPGVSKTKKYLLDIPFVNENFDFQNFLLTA